MRKSTLVSAVAGAVLAAGLFVLAPGMANADTPRNSIRLDKFGAVKDAVGKGGERPLLIQDERPAKPGRELQEIVIDKITITIHEPTNTGVPPHTMESGDVHGCHQWVYVPPTWYLVHC